MKKRFAMILALLVLLCGCGEEPEQTFATRPPAETVRYGHTPVESAPTAPAEEETDEVRVTDAFADKAVMVDYDETYYYHIPAIHIPGVNTDEINDLMYNELYAFINQYVYDNPDYPYLGDMAYSWAVHGGILSVITEVVVGPDSSPNPMYVVYNVDLTTGQRVFGEEVLAAFGMEEETYRQQVRAVLDSTFLFFSGQQEGDFYRQQYDKTVSDDNVSNAIVYIDARGELAVVADIYAMAGADSYRHLLCLSGAQATRPKAEPFE